MVHENIRYIRKSLLDLTQPEFAEIISGTGIKVTRAMIDAYERKLCNVPEEILISIANYCNLTVHDLINKDLKKIGKLKPIISGAKQPSLDEQLRKKEVLKRQLEIQLSKVNADMRVIQKEKEKEGKMRPDKGFIKNEARMKKR